MSNAMVRELRRYSVSHGPRNRGYAVRHYNLAAFLDALTNRFAIPAHRGGVDWGAGFNARP